MANPESVATAVQTPPAPAPQLLIDEDGEVYRTPSDKVAAAVASGRYRPLTPAEQLTHRVEKEEEARGPIGSLAEAGKSALNQLLLGVPGAITEGQETPEQKSEREARETYHKGARFVGGAVGVGGSLLAGGEVFKALDLAGQAVSRGILPAEEAAQAGLATRFAAKAANMATQGALLSTPQAVVQAAFGDPQKAAETLLWGIGTGAALGGAGELLASAGKAAVEGVTGLAGKAEIPEALQRFVQEKTPGLFGAQPSQLSRLSPERIGDVSKFAQEEVIRPGMTKADLVGAVEAAHEKYGGQLGDTLKSLDDALLKPEAKQTAMSGAALGQSDIALGIQKELDTPDLRMAMHADQKRALDTILQDAANLPTTEIAGGQKVVKFEDANNFLTTLRKKYSGPIQKALNEGGVRGVEAVTPLDQVKLAAYQAAKKVVHAAADRVAEVSEQPALVGQLVKSKAAYSKVAELERWLGRAEHQEGVDRFTRIQDSIRSAEGGEGGFLAPAVQAMGAGLGGIIGGVPGAFVGERVGKVSYNLLKGLASRWVEDRGMVALTNLAHRAAKEGPEVFSAVMASEGAKRLGAAMETVNDSIRVLAQRGIQEVGNRKKEHMKALLDSTVGLTPEQQENKLQGRLEQLVSNPEAMSNVTSALASPYSSTAPDVSEAYQAKLAQTLQYLYASFPKPPNAPAPFTPNYWSPAAQDKLAMHDKLEIVNNPMAAMRHVQQGTLSSAHMDALTNVYPVVLDMMRRQVLQFHADHPDVKLPLAERQSVAKLLGTSLSSLDTPDARRALQASFTAPQQGGAQPPAKPRGKSLDKNPQTRSTSFTSTMGPGEPGEA